MERNEIVAIIEALREREQEAADRAVGSYLKSSHRHAAGVLSELIDQMPCSEEEEIVGALCVWPGTSLGDSDPGEFVKFAADTYNVRVGKVREVETLTLAQNGQRRKDLVFVVHVEDVSRFAVTRVRTGVKWMADWLPGHACEYTTADYEQFKAMI